MEESLWVVTTQANQLSGLEVDPVDEAVRWGSIYWAKVIKIDKALDAAFVDLDGETQGLLHNKDLRLLDNKGKLVKNADLPMGKRIQPGDCVVVQAKSGYLPHSNAQDIAIEDKCPRVSMNITLPGRYLIFSPMMDENRISKRILDKKRRKQLTRMLNSVDNIKGCILRAAAADIQTDILIRESKILKEIWDQLQQFLVGKEPTLIMEGPDAIQRTLSDNADQTIDQIEVVTMDRYQEVEEWCEIYAPDLVTKIQPIETAERDSDLELFDFRDVLDQIEDLFQSYVLLKKGGNIIIQQTAALCAIDVNRSGDTRSNLAINLEALEEVSRQIRLRNLGGIIIVDLLKLKSKKETEHMMMALKDMINNDPCTVQIHGQTGLGLLELTRHRRTPPLEERVDLVLG
jgi:Rne/Rng family ribonuclease